MWNHLRFPIPKLSSSVFKKNIFKCFFFIISNSMLTCISKSDFN